MGISQAWGLFRQNLIKPKGLFRQNPYKPRGAKKWGISLLNSGKFRKFASWNTWRLDLLLAKVKATHTTRGAYQTEATPPLTRELQSSLFSWVTVLSIYHNRSSREASKSVTRLTALPLVVAVFLLGCGRWLRRKRLRLWGVKCGCLVGCWQMR